jgi:hypothetical protein
MAQSMSFVGLDVHASQTHAAVLGSATRDRGVRLHGGIDALSAAGLCAEIGNWQRFRHKPPQRSCDFR